MITPQRIERACKEALGYPKNSILEASAKNAIRTLIVVGDLNAHIANDADGCICVERRMARMGVTSTFSLRDHRALRRTAVFWGIGTITSLRIP